MIKWGKWNEVNEIIPSNGMKLVHKVPHVYGVNHKEVSKGITAWTHCLYLYNNISNVKYMVISMFFNMSINWSP